MTRERLALIVSTVADVATDDVVRRLAARGIPHYRVNTEDYPFSRTIALAAQACHRKVAPGIGPLVQIRRPRNHRTHQHLVPACTDAPEARRHGLRNL